MPKITPEEMEAMEARYGAMTLDKIDAEVARLRADAARRRAHADALEDHTRQQEMRRLNLHIVK